MIENLWIGHGQEWLWKYGLWSVKLTVCQEWTDGINWFFACWYKFMQIEMQLEIFWVGMVKNGCGQPGNGSLKLTVSEEWTDEITDFLHVGTNSRKLKVDSMIFRWVWSNMAMVCQFMRPQNLLHLNEFMNWADILNVATDAIIFG